MWEKTFELLDVNDDDPSMFWNLVRVVSKDISPKLEYHADVISGEESLYLSGGAWEYIGRPDDLTALEVIGLLKKGWSVTISSCDISSDGYGGFVIQITLHGINDSSSDVEVSEFNEPIKYSGLFQ